MVLGSEPHTKTSNIQEEWMKGEKINFCTGHISMLTERYFLLPFHVAFRCLIAFEL